MNKYRPLHVLWMVFFFCLAVLSCKEDKASKSKDGEPLDITEAFWGVKTPQLDPDLTAKQRRVAVWLLKWPPTNPSRHWREPKPFDSYKEWEVAAENIGGVEETLLRLYQENKIRTNPFLFCEAFARVGTSRSVPTLVMIMEDDDQSVRIRKTAIWALGLIGAQIAVEPLCEFLVSTIEPSGKISKEEQVDLRLDAIAALGMIGDPNAAPIVRSALHRMHISLSSKTSILLYLAQIEEAEALRYKLPQTLVTEEERRVLHWLWRLPQYGRAQNRKMEHPLLYSDLEWYKVGSRIENLERIIHLLYTHDRHSLPPFPLSVAIFHFGSADSVPLLLDLVEGEEYGYRAKYYAISKVGSIGDSVAVDCLCRLVSSPDNLPTIGCDYLLPLRFHAAHALWRIGDPEAIPALDEILKADGLMESDREDIARWLADLKQKREIPDSRAPEHKIGNSTIG